jgi:serine/threonine protein kinase
MVVGNGVLPDRYARPRVIGRGGMGEIYAAEDTELGRQVAIKLLDERFSDREDLRRRFRREALTAARLSGDPHIVTIYDVGEYLGRPFIVMKYLSGGSLAERARNGPLSPREALSWLEQAAEALDSAHAEGVVHRDVKPANLLLDDSGRLEVADFGIARAIDDTEGMTAAGTLMGTAGYLAPEQARGEPASPASDRYALAIVAFELLTGGRPFERRSETAEAAAHITDPVPLASERGVGLPDSVDAVFERALAKDPAARFPSAAGFVQALGAALAGPTAMPTRILTTSSPPPRHRARRAVWLAPLAALGLLAALVGGIAAAVLGADGNGGARDTSPHVVTVTHKVVKTVAGEGETVTNVVTTTAPAASATPPPASSAPSVAEAISLTDQSTYALRRNDWEEAERLAREAYPALAGTYSSSNPYEAYVNFDLGAALAAQGRCSSALRYLGRSEELQGPKDAIAAAKRQCGI